MSNTGAQGTVWNLPGYTGEILCASPKQTPLLTLMGGLARGGYISTDFEFPLNAYYSLRTAAQPAVTETASLAYPAPIGFVKAQAKNVCQKHHESVIVSYDRMAGRGRLSGINTEGLKQDSDDELAFQLAGTFKQIATDIEKSIITGTYSIATTAGTYNATRGLNAAAVPAGNTVAAGGDKLSTALIKTLIRTMYSNNADFEDPVFVVNLFQKEQITDLYKFAPMDRNVGGANIKQVETDVGNVGVMLNPFQTTSVLLIADLAKCAPVWMNVPGKGNFFYEPTSKLGASENGQVFGYFGLDYGADQFHGSITGLATS
jgi:hypothetical protein